MNILLIRLRLIGDVVFTTPAIRALRRQFPDARLSYLVESEVAPVVADSPHLDDVIVVPRPRGWRRLVADWATARDLRRRRFDVAIDFHGGPRSGWLTWASGAPVRIGYEVAGRSWLYTTPVNRPRALRPRHSVENQWDLLAGLHPIFLQPPDPRRDSVEMAARPSAANAMAERLVRLGIGPEHALIVVHVSAGNPFRRWPAESFIALAAALIEADPQRRIIFVSGPSEAGAAVRISHATRERLGPRRAQAIVSLGECDLHELRALIAGAALYIGGDTGPLHIAATTDVPILGLYGPTEPIRSAPWRDPARVTESVDVGALPCRPCDQRRCAPGDFRCLTRLEPAAVVTAAERALRRADHIRCAASQAGPARAAQGIHHDSPAEAGQHIRRA